MADLDFDALEAALASAAGDVMSDVPTEREQAEIARASAAAPPEVRRWVVRMVMSRDVMFAASLFGYAPTFRKMAEGLRANPALLGFRDPGEARTVVGQLMASSAADILDVMADCTERHDSGSQAGAR